MVEKKQGKLAEKEEKGARRGERGKQCAASEEKNEGGHLLHVAQ